MKPPFIASRASKVPKDDMDLINVCLNAECREAGFRGLAKAASSTVMNENDDIGAEEGSTNAYGDLGYADAAEMQRKSQLAAEIARAIKAR